MKYENLILAIIADVFIIAIAHLSDFGYTFAEYVALLVVFLVYLPFVYLGVKAASKLGTKKQPQETQN